MAREDQEIPQRAPYAYGAVSRFYVYCVNPVLGLPVAADNVIPFDTEVFDGLGEATLGVAANFTPLVAGYYVIVASAYLNTLTLNRETNLHIRRNGAQISSHRIRSLFTDWHLKTIIAAVYLNAGDVIDVITRHGIALDPNYALAGGISFTYFCGHRLS